MEGKPVRDAIYHRLSLLKRLYYVDFFKFTKELLGFSDLTEKTHGDLINFLIYDTTPRKLILMPRGTFKTTIITISYSIWRIVRDRDIRILLCADVYPNAVNYLYHIRRIFESNEMLNFLYGNFVNENRWRENEIEVLNRAMKCKEATVTVSTDRSTKVGMHYDLIICLAKDTLIITDRGLEKIQNLTLEHKVLSHKGRFCNILCLGKRKANTLKIKLRASTEPIIMTEEHPVYVKDKGFIKAKELKTGDLVKAPFFSNSEISVYSEDFWEMIGWWIAEGSFNSNSPFWTFHRTKDTRGIELVRNFARQNNIKTREKIEGETLRIFYNASFFNEFISQFKTKPYKKNIPGFVFELDRKYIVALLRGWYLGDGNRQAHGYRIASNSLELIYSARLLLSKLGYYGTIFRGRNGENIIFYLMLGKKFGDIIGITEKSKTRWPYRYKVIDGEIYNIVEKIEDNGFTDVYNMRVEDDNSFCTPDLITHNCDDVVSDINIMTQEQKRKVIEYFRSLFSILEPNGEMIVVGTRWAEDDLYGFILKRLSGIFSIFTRKIYNKDGSLFFPERFPESKLKELKELQGTVMFSSQYLNEPISDESEIFRNFSTINIKEVPQRLNISITIDPAISLKKESDDTGIVVCGTDEAGVIYVLDAISGKYKPSDIVDLLFYLNQKHSPYLIGIETVAFQKIFSYYIQEEEQRRGIFLPIRELKPEPNKSKFMRILALQPLVERGQIKFVDTTGVRNLINEMKVYPHGKDDMIDALAYQLSVATKPSPQQVESEIDENRWVARIPRRKVGEFFRVRSVWEASQ